jgi:hypothetical protein
MKQEEMKKEVKDLKSKLKEADLSVENPGIQQVFENELSRWVESYEFNKSSKGILHDFYGGPGDIPDQIEINEKNYSPQEILEHVKARDEVGMNILRQMQKYRDEHELYGKIKEAVLQMVDDGVDLEDNCLRCICGRHNLTYRQVLEGMINGNPDLMFLEIGVPNAIMKLYGRVEEF